MLKMEKKATVRFDIGCGNLKVIRPLFSVRTFKAQLDIFISQLFSLKTGDTFTNS